MRRKDLRKMNKQEKKELLLELKEEFAKVKKELNLKSDFDELDEVFFITDFVLHESYVSEDFSRQMCSRIRDTLNVWANYLHSLLMPNPQYLINLTEAKLFKEDERKEVWELLKGALALSSLNTLSGMTKDKKKEKEFIDGSLDFWHKKYKPGIVKILKKVNDGWKGGV